MNKIEIKLLLSDRKKEAVNSLLNNKHDDIAAVRELQGMIRAYETIASDLSKLEIKLEEDLDDE